MVLEQVWSLHLVEAQTNLVRFQEEPLLKYPYGVMVAQQPPKLFGESPSLSRGAFYLKTIYKIFSLYYNVFVSKDR